MRSKLRVRAGLGSPGPQPQSKLSQVRTRKHRTAEPAHAATQSRCFPCVGASDSGGRVLLVRPAQDGLQPRKAIPTVPKQVHGCASASLISISLKTARVASPFMKRVTS